MNDDLLPPEPAVLLLPDRLVELDLLPLFDTVVFPLTVTPLTITQEQSVRLIDEVVDQHRLLVLTALNGPRPATLHTAACYRVGTAAVVHRLLRLPDGTLRVAMEGIERVQIEEFTSLAPNACAQVRALPDTDRSEDAALLNPLLHTLRGQLAELAHYAPQLAGDLPLPSDAHTDPWRASFLAAALLRHLPLAERQELLELRSAHARLERLFELLARETAALQTRRQFAPPRANDQPANPLPSRLTSVAACFARDLVGLEQARRYLLGYLASHVIGSQVASEPASQATEAQGSVAEAVESYNLQSAIRRVLWLVGPAGVGKSSLARAIAKGLGRHLTVLPLDWLTAESLTSQAEQAITQAGVAGAVLLFPEMVALDNLNLAEALRSLIKRPWPAPAPLFVLESRTADLLPVALRPFTEQVELPGLCRQEKLRIASTHLLPATLRRHTVSEQIIPATILRTLIDSYTNEDGVAQLAAIIERLCQALGVEQALVGTQAGPLDAAALWRLLGPPTHRPELLWQRSGLGAVVGLATTSSEESKASALMVEAALVPGSGQLVAAGGTHQQHAWLAESPAWSCVRTHAQQLGLDAETLRRYDILAYLSGSHEAQGDAGLDAALAVAIVAALHGWSPAGRTTLAAGISLYGTLLPCDKLSNRLLAAERIGATRIVLPAVQRDEAERIALAFREYIQLVFVQTLQEAVVEVLDPSPFIYNSEE